MSEVVLDRVCRTFAPDVAAVDDVSLTARAGELVVLVGPSGCGKTTTLRLIAGLDRPTSGSIRVDGQDMRGVPPGRRDIAMAFQDAPLYPHMTVRRNLAFPLRALRIPRSESDRRVDEAAKLLGIAGLLDRRPAALSGGERQRVALGRTVVRRPRVWLLDEPLSDLEPALRLQLRGEIKSLQRRFGITTIHVTHDQEEAMALADRLVVMRSGSVQQIGSPVALYRRPENRFVAGFLGSHGMNFIAGRVQVDSRGARIEHCSDSALALTPGSFDMRTATVGNEVLLGIRPEHLGASPSMNPSPSLAARVLQIEPLGDQANIIVETSAGARVIWRASAGSFESLAAGQTCRLIADPAHVHLFEAGEPGRSLCVDSPEA